MASLACAEAIASRLFRMTSVPSSICEGSGAADCTPSTMAGSFRTLRLQPAGRQRSLMSSRLFFPRGRISTAVASSSTEPVNDIGYNPEWSDSDYIAVGLAHCFVKDENAKLQDHFVIEAIPAGGLECMENGGVTCFKFVTGTTLGKVLKQDASVLPEEFRAARFSDEFDFRAKCASRTWKRQHPQENLMHLAPEGKVRSDFNFNLDDKRILNVENEVNDSDNIKQDLSIDVYGRKEETSEAEAPSVEALYNA
eukprot:TRINITY_DN20812_c0_g1_i1.p1 TRINITY_DN20812_c0_g1~~TRINITY_DN20812_c0_g1_i1.p1  ORF type:complete len:289 (+),score=56.63 TRINITY_DN20812_c0_g1_i1:110-868(+)